MRISTIYDVEDMDDADIVKAIKGKVLRIFPFRTDDPDDGKPWSIQTVVLSDGEDEIKATFKDRMEEIPKNWKGRTLYLESQNAGGRWTGIKVKDDKYKSKGKTVEERILWVTPSASVGFDDEEPEQEEEEQSSRRSSRKSRKERTKRRADPVSDDETPPTSKRKHEAAKADPRDQYVQTKVKLSKIANLWIITAEAAVYCKEAYEARFNCEMPESLFDSCLGQMYAEAKSCGMTGDVPLVDLRSELVPHRKEPEDEDLDEDIDEEDEYEEDED